MKNKKVTIALVLGILVVLLTGVFLVVFMNLDKTNATVEEKTTDITMFSAYTEAEEFQNVPALAPEGTKVGLAENHGRGCQVIDVNGTEVDDYKGYLKTLEKAGFKKYSDNGEDAMEGYVYTATFKKDNLVLTISHSVKINKTYITAAFDLPLSEHLNYQEKYVEDVIPGKKTTVHLMQLHNNGNSFVIQLKNGHFILHDGGKDIDAPYLLDYLEKLAPEGEKPVVEAWFISHAHSDHYGAPGAIATNMSWAKRLIVEGFYFVEPDSKVTAAANLSSAVWTTKMLNTAFVNSEGEKPEMYRPQFGQRYYFCDMSIDIAITPEIFPLNTYYQDDFNDTSLWLMHHIDGQRFLIPGDGSHTAMQFAMRAFDQSYFEVDIFAVAHHGINVYDYFVEFCTADTLLYTVFRTASMYDAPSGHAHLEEHARMQELAKESLSHGEGTVVLSFPYSVGSSETIASWDWRYDGGVAKRTQWGGN